MSHHRSLKQALVLITLSLVSTGIFATDWPTTEAEFSLLPPYCKARHGPRYGIPVPEAEISKWKRVLGPGFLHVHHYCAGLNTLNAIDRRSSSPQAHELIGVLTEFEYTQTHSPEDFPLQPKISVDKGKVLLRLDRISDAVMEFRHAIELKPTYTPPYVALSDYYVEKGQIEEAKKILEEGLKHSPESSRLKRRLKKL